MSGFRIATIRGIPIRVHITLLLVLPLLAYGFMRDFRAAAALAEVPPELVSGSPLIWGLAVALALFASVLVHELAHSLYALRVGGRVRGITLLMIGGVSHISEPPREARDEAVMALVGPAVSLLLGGAFLAGHAIADTASFDLRFALFYLGTLNLFLGAFNLLPAFPMDGGRILRAILTPRLGAIRATSVAAVVGKAFAVAFAIWGFVTFNLMLLVIAFFVFMGAEGEARGVVVRALLGRIRVADLMGPPPLWLEEGATVHRAAERMLAERRLAFAAPVDGRQYGLITLDAVQAVPLQARATTPVSAIAMETPPVAPDEDAGRALRIMTESDVPQLAVVSDGQVVGTITQDDIVRGLRLGELERTQRGEGWWERPSGGIRDPHGNHPGARIHAR